MITCEGRDRGMTTELVKVYDGYIVKVGRLYISGYRNGIYSYVIDYTYAKHYSRATAQKHIDRIKEG